MMSDIAVCSAYVKKASYYTRMIGSLIVMLYVEIVLSLISDEGLRDHNILLGMDLFRSSPVQSLC